MNVGFRSISTVATPSPHRLCNPPRDPEPPQPLPQQHPPEPHLPSFPILRRRPPATKCLIPPIYPTLRRKNSRSQTPSRFSRHLPEPICKKIGQKNADMRAH